MTNQPMTVVQCWDDGVHNDIRVCEILRRHKATGSFNLNAGKHLPQRSAGWTFKNTQVERLGWDEMRDTYAGFTIANHSLTHPRLEQIDIAAARQDIVDGRDRLQQFFQQPVLGFAYPYGSYNEAVVDAVRDAGHVYARTTDKVTFPCPPENPMRFHPNCHFLAPDFWERFEAARPGGVFYFWGHSYEMVTEEMWSTFDAKIARISADPAARWGELVGLFTTPA